MLSAYSWASWFSGAVGMAVHMNGSVVCRAVKRVRGVLMSQPSKE
jgi:hypothetical protein